MGVGSYVSAILMVFVYGTLKRGEPNHSLLAKPDNGVAKFIGVGKTAEKYPLVIASKYNIPFLLDVPGTGDHIEGEVYEIDDKMLSNLDILEEYPTSYSRRLEKIMMENNTEVKCWMYFLKRHKKSLQELPIMTSYSSSGDHGLAYVEQHKRVDPLYDYKAEVILNYTKNKYDV